MTETEMRSAELTIRMVRSDEGGALVRLAERDSARAPSGSVLGAFAGGELVAASSIDTGELVADPFTPTGDVRALLTRRVHQLRGKDGRSGGFFAPPLREARGV